MRNECKYRDELRIKNKKWMGCSYFNCELNQEYCKKCSEKDFPEVYISFSEFKPQTELKNRGRIIRKILI